MKSIEELRSLNELKKWIETIPDEKDYEIIKKYIKLIKEEHSTLMAEKLPSKKVSVEQIESIIQFIKTKYQGIPIDYIVTDSILFDLKQAGLVEVVE